MASKTLNQRLAQWLIGPELKEMAPTWRPSLKFSFWTKEILEFNAVLIQPVQELLNQLWPNLKMKAKLNLPHCTIEPDFIVQPRIGIVDLHKVRRMTNVECTERRWQVLAKSCDQIMEEFSMRQHQPNSNQEHDTPETLLQRYRAAIAAAFPEFGTRPMRLLGQGWDNDAVCVDEQLVFRFPRRADVVPHVTRERCILEVIAPRLPLPIPKFSYYGHVPTVFPWPFAGYPLLPGVPLAEIGFDRLDLVAAGKSLGQFLHALHHTPTDLLASCDLRVYTPAAWVDRHLELLAHLRPELRRFFAPALADRLIDHWQRVWSAQHVQAFTPCLIHSDLNPDHLLVDPQTGQLTGIIDFSDACLADPATDFAELPDPLAAVAFEHYACADNQFWERRAVLRAMVPFHALAFGLETANQQIIADALAALQQQVAQLDCENRTSGGH